MLRFVALVISAGLPTTASASCIHWMNDLPMYLDCKFEEQVEIINENARLLDDARDDIQNLQIENSGLKDRVFDLEQKVQSLELR
jgi:predicted nuclease with TOPRIM domain